MAEWICGQICVVKQSGVGFCPAFVKIAHPRNVRLLVWRRNHNRIPLYFRGGGYPFSVDKNLETFQIAFGDKIAESVKFEKHDVFSIIRLFKHGAVRADIFLIVDF